MRDMGPRGDNMIRERPCEDVLQPRLSPLLLLDAVFNARVETERERQTVSKANTPPM